MIDPTVQDCGTAYLRAHKASIRDTGLLIQAEFYNKNAYSPEDITKLRREAAKSWHAYQASFAKLCDTAKTSTDVETCQYWAELVNAHFGNALNDLGVVRGLNADYEAAARATTFAALSSRSEAGQTMEAAWHRHRQFWVDHIASLEAMIAHLEEEIATEQVSSTFETSVHDDSTQEMVSQLVGQLKVARSRLAEFDKAGVDHLPDLVVDLAVEGFGPHYYQLETDIERQLHLREHGDRLWHRPQHRAATSVWR